MDRYSLSLKDKIRKIAPDASDYEVCAVWAEILDAHFPHRKNDSPFDLEFKYSLLTELGFELPFLRTIVVRSQTVVPVTLILHMHIKSAPEEDVAFDWQETEAQLREEMDAALNEVMRVAKMNMHGAIAMGPFVRFYTFMPNGTFIPNVKAGREVLHLVNDHHFIAGHLEFIKGDAF